MKQKAVFFDRDGTLIKEVHYLSQRGQIELFASAASLAQLKAQGYFLAMVTNQSGVARGFFPESFVREVYNDVNLQLSVMGASLNALEYCPHHLEGKPPYNVPCRCRKPMTGMIDRLGERFRLDLESSWMIGDKLIDIELAHHAKLRAGLVLTGYGEQEKEKVLTKYPMTQVFEGLEQAVDYILSN